MANPNFDVSTITTSGAAMLAQATEGNKVIFSGCEANSTVYTLEQAKAVAAITGTRISDGIEVTDVTDARILVRATFEPSAATGGDANSLILFGRLSSQDENTRTPICVVSNSTSFYLPEYNQFAITAFDCLFTVQYNISSPVVVEQTSALECSLAEFRQLKDRVVTTHKAGENYVGEAQEIYGLKTFKQNVSAESNLNVSGNIAAHYVLPNGSSCYIGTEESEWKCIYCNSANFSESLVVGSTSYFSNIVPKENDTSSLGSSALKWSNVWARNVYAVDGVAATDITVSGGISFSDGSVSHSILPAEDKNGSIGASDKRWKYVYADGGIFDGLVTAGSLLAASSVGSLGTLSVAGAATIGSSLDVSGEAAFSGSVLAKSGIDINGKSLVFKELDGTSYFMRYYSGGIDVYGHLSPGTGSAYSLGTTNYRWSDLYVQSLSGSTSAFVNLICPSTDTSTTVSIGSVLIIVVRAYQSASATSVTVARGTVFSSSKWTMYAGSFSTTGISTGTPYGIAFLNVGLSTVLSGSYRLMSQLYFNENTSSTAAYFYSTALAVRVA